MLCFFFFSSRRRHTRCSRDWSSDVCSSDLLGNVLMGVVAVPFWGRLAPYQQNRLLAFLNPEVDPRATGWHVIQSKIAIGSGGLRSEEHTSELQSRLHLVCRLLLEKKKTRTNTPAP